MNEFTEVTAENLRRLRGSREMNQNDIADILGIPQNAVSGIEKGKRALSASEKSLLDLYFFGKMPFDITNEVLLKSILEFSPLQWRVISILANKRGQLPGKWIADQIRSFLAYDEDGRKITEEHSDSIDRKANISLVAEDPTIYKTKTEGN